VHTKGFRRGADCAEAGKHERCSEFQPMLHRLSLA
jgi:hypothetical protein